MTCPNCRDDHSIDVQITTWARIIEEGDGNVQTDEMGSHDQSHEWNEDSPAMCESCGFTGKISDFEALGLGGSRAESA